MQPSHHPWPPPAPPGNTPRDELPIGWYQAGDGRWYATSVPPAPGYWLASDLRWCPPPPVGALGPTEPLPDDERWRASRWGLGDAWWGALVFFVASIVVGIAIVAVIAATSSRSIEDVELGPYGVSASILANVAAFAGVPWLATRRKGQRSLRADFGLRVRPRDLAIGIGTGFGALIAASVVGNALDAVLGADKSTSNVPVDTLTGPGQLIAMLLAVGVVTPIIEELFFRGLVYRSLLKRGMRTPAAIATTVVVFTLPHLLAVPEWPNVVTLFVSIAVLGLAFNLACHRTGNRLGAAIVAHMVINCTAVVVLYAQSR